MSDLHRLVRMPDLFERLSDASRLCACWVQVYAGHAAIS